MGRVVSRQEMFEETVYQPQQVLDPAAGRQVFEANCASCHRFQAVGTDHGVAGLNLSASTLRASKHALLEAVFFPERKIQTGLETTTVDAADGKTVSGLVVKETAQSVSLLTPAGTVTEIPKAQIKARRKTKASIMPDALAETIDRAGLRNLAAYLAQ